MLSGRTSSLLRWLGAPSRTSKTSCRTNLRASTSRKAWKQAVFEVGMKDFAVLDEFVARGETEQTQDLLGSWVGTTALLGIEREVLNVVAFHGETQFTLDQGLNEEAEKVEGELRFDPALVLQKDRGDFMH